MVILKLKSINDVDIKNVLLSNKISSVEGSYKYFIGYLMLPKTSAYVKVMMVELNACIFWLMMMTYWKNMILFGIKSELILDKNLIGNLSKITNIEEQKQNLTVIKQQIFTRKKCLRQVLIILV